MTTAQANEGGEDVRRHKRANDFRNRPAKHVTALTFVGGTGRSGTHIVARFLGRHNRLAAIGVECRFHVEERGFPGLMDGSVTRDQFMERLRGFWWKGKMSGRERGMFRFVPEDRFEEAASTFEENFDPDVPEAACRQLFLDLLWPYAAEEGASGLVEQSCDSIAQAETLMRLFPEAKFIHVVRDGRDASASRVSQTRGIVYPRTRKQGIDWFEKRIRRIDAGAQLIPDLRLMQVSLEDILTPPRFEAAREVTNFVGVRFGQRMRRFFFARMDLHSSNAERWRQDISERRQDSLDRRYRHMLEGLEADGVSCAPLLRKAYEEPRVDVPPPEEASESG